MGAGEVQFHTVMSGHGVDLHLCDGRYRHVFKVFGGKDTLLYASLCVGAVGGVCTAGNFMPATG